jgi:hypothetical protein
LGQYIKEYIPKSGLIYVVDLPSFKEYFILYRRDDNYPKELLSNLKRIAEEFGIEIKNEDYILDEADRDKAINAMLAVQLLPDAMIKMIKEVAFGKEGKQGMFSFSAYDDIIWIKLRGSGMIKGIIEAIKKNLDLIKEYIRYPQELRKKAIDELKAGNIELAKRYLYLKENIYQGLEYGDLNSGWFYDVNKMGIFYCDGNGNKGYVSYGTSL